MCDINVTADRRCMQTIMSRVIEVVLDFRDREMYDKLSMNFVRSGIFSILIKSIVVAKPLPEAEYK